MKRYKIEEIENDIKKAIDNSLTMSEACYKLGMHFNTFKRYAQKLNLYKPNQGGKGTNKPYRGNNKYELKDILDGKVPYYSTFKLKIRLLKEGIKQNICEICGISEWNNKQLNMELDHIDGNRFNHSLDNLRMICPNCHAQTDTYRSKNAKYVKSEKNCKICENTFERKLGDYCSRKCSNSSRKGNNYKIDWPNNIELKKLVDEYGYSATGRKLGVSDNAIRKHLNKAP